MTKQKQTRKQQRQHRSRLARAIRPDNEVAGLPPSVAPQTKRAPNRPSAYRPEFAQMLREYATSESFEIEEILKNGRIVRVRVPKAPPTLARFAQQIAGCPDTIHKWSTEVHPTGHPQAGQLVRPEFSEAVAYAKAAQEAILLEGAVLGLYNAPAAQFALKNYSGLQDKVEVEQKAFPGPTAEELDAIYAANRKKCEEFNRGYRHPDVHSRGDVTAEAIAPLEVADAAGEVTVGPTDDPFASA